MVEENMSLRVSFISANFNYLKLVVKIPLHSYCRKRNFPLELSSTGTAITA